MSRPGRTGHLRTDATPESTGRLRAKSPAARRALARHHRATARGSRLGATAVSRRRTAVGTNSGPAWRTRHRTCGTGYCSTRRLFVRNGGTHPSRARAAPPSLLVERARLLPEPVRPAVAVRAGVLREGLGGAGSTRTLRPSRPAAGTRLSGHGHASFRSCLRRDAGGPLHPAGAGPLDHPGSAVGHRAGTSGHRRSTRTLAPRNHRRNHCRRGSHRSPVTRADPPWPGHTGRPARLVRSTRAPAGLRPLGLRSPPPATRLITGPAGAASPGLRAGLDAGVRPGIHARPGSTLRAGLTTPVRAGIHARSAGLTTPVCAGIHARSAGLTTPVCAGIHARSAGLATPVCAGLRARPGSAGLTAGVCPGLGVRAHHRVPA
jgi:hypothetical protein